LRANDEAPGLAAQTIVTLALCEAGARSSRAFESFARRWSSAGLRDHPRAIGWAVFALHAASSAGFDVCVGPLGPGGLDDGDPDAARPDVLAAALFARVLVLGEPRSSDAIRRDGAALARRLPSVHDLAGACFTTWALEHLGWWPSREWDAALKAALLARRRTHGGARGSWDASGPTCSRAEATALAALALEAMDGSPEPDFGEARRAVYVGRSADELDALPPRSFDGDAIELSLPAARPPRVTRDPFAPGSDVPTETAVRAALDGLVRHQEQDGGWSPDPYCVDADGRCVEYPPDPGLTGLALLALLRHGETHRSASTAAHRDAVRHGLQHLLRVQRSDGSFAVTAPGPGAIDGDALATLALWEAYGLTGDPALALPARRATCALAVFGARGWRAAALDAARAAGLLVFPLRTAPHGLAERPDEVTCPDFVIRTALDALALERRLEAP
jgi:hypothetical protein